MTTLPPLFCVMLAIQMFAVRHLLVYLDHFDKPGPHRYSRRQPEGFVAKYVAALGVRDTIIGGGHVVCILVV
jgi:hypothetical protein